MRSGDRFRIDETGYLYFLGRLDDMFKSRGQRVSPREIENVLNSCRALPVPPSSERPMLSWHARYGVRGVMDDPAVTEQDIVRHCAARLEDFLVPEVHLVSEFPRTTSGKLDRRSSSQNAREKPLVNARWRVWRAYRPDGGGRFAHWDALRSMEGQWSRNPMIVWVHRSAGWRADFLAAPGRLAWCDAAPASAGALVLLFGAGMLIVGRPADSTPGASGVHRDHRRSGLFIFGTRYARAALPSLCYLLLMVPFWDAFTEPLHWPLQQQSAEMGVAFMRWVGVPAYREQRRHTA